MVPAFVPLLALIGAAAATPPAPRFPRTSIQVDPVLFGLRGYSIFLGFAVAPHWNVAIGSFAGDVPGQPEGWTARTRFAPEAHLTAFLRDDNRGAYLALGLGMLQWGLEHDDVPGATAEFDQVVFTPTAGFRWFPVDAWSLFVDPFLAVGVPIFGVGATHIGDHEYDQPFTSLLLPGVFVGWEFGGTDGQR